MTGPHLIIMAIGLTGALTSVWLLRQNSGHRPSVARSTATSSEQMACAPVETFSASTHKAASLTDPVLVVRQACLAMEDVARRRQIDLLRPFNISASPLDVPSGPLVSLLKSVIQNALEATPRKGAVICSIKMTSGHVHFVVSDSSGCAEDGAALLAEPRWRRESLDPSSLVAGALGGHMTYTDHPGEGVVIDLSFARRDTRRGHAPDHLAPWSANVGNDHSATDRQTAPA